MALREKHPNAGLGQVSGFADRPIRLSKLSEKTSLLKPTSNGDDNKENQPPPSHGMERSMPIQQQPKAANVENFLTEKWTKEAAQSSPQTLMTPPPIQRANRALQPKQNGNHVPRGRPVVEPPTQILPRCVMNNGKLEGFSGSSLSCDSFQVELDFLGRTRHAAGLFGTDQLESIGQNNRVVDSTETVSTHKDELSNSLDFSKALRQNLDTSTTEGQHQPVSPLTKVKDKQQKNPGPKSSKGGGNTVSIRTLATSKERGAAEHAEFLLREMLCDFHEGVTDAPPDGGCFNSVVHAYASRGDATKAEAVLALMWHEFYRGNLPPDKRIFTTVMYAWQRSDKKLEAPDACEHLLRQMHQLNDTGMAPACGPDTFTYTCILHCWANSDRPDASVRAECLFRAMIQRYEGGDKNLQPDTICYSNLINVFVNCGRKYHDAERILWEMVDSYLSGLDSAEPTVRSFNTLLAVWSKSSLRESPERVQMILQRWRDLKQQGKIAASPDEYSYALLLKAWTKTNRLDAVHKLLEVFEWIKNLYDAGEDCACPDVIKYTTVIGALNKVGQVDRAFVLLGELINKYNEFKLERYKPDARCFHIVLTAFSRCKDNVSAGKKAESLLRRMWTLYKADARAHVQPTSWTYNTVIFCYQNAGDPKRADRLLQEMDHLARMGSLDRGADIRTYKAVASAWRVSNEQTKHAHIRSLQAEARDRFKQQI